VGALVLGVGIALIGLAVKPLHFLYDYAWFGGFFTSGAVYGLLMKLFPPTPRSESSLARTDTV